MKLRQFISLFFLFFGILLPCQAATVAVQASPSVNEEQEIETYYFHTSRRCAGCLKAESAFKKAVTELFEDQVEVSAYNLDTEEGRQFAQKKGVRAQAAMIFVGEQRLDVTGDCFRYSQDVESLKSALKKKINPVL